MIKHIVTAILCLSVVTSVYGARVDNVKVVEKDGTLEVHIFTDASKYRDFTQSPSNLEYSMIVLDFFDTQHNMPTNWTEIEKGNLLRIRSSQFTKRVTRVVLDVNRTVDYKVHKEEKEIVVRLGKPAGWTKGTAKNTNSKESEGNGKAKSYKGIVYSSGGKRDPFRPLIKSKPATDTLLDVSHATLKGIMWSPKERYALLQDPKGKGYILEEGDKVSGGKVLYVRQKEVVFALYGFGEIKRVTLKITSKEKK